MEFYTDRIVKARKVHKCELCGQNIKVGEKYHRQSGKYEGEFFDRCHHMTCDKIIASYCSENNENEYDDDHIIDWLGNIYCYDCEKEEDCEIEILQCEHIRINFRELVEEEKE